MYITCNREVEQLGEKKKKKKKKSENSNSLCLSREAWQLQVDGKGQYNAWLQSPLVCAMAVKMSPARRLQ